MKVVNTLIQFEIIVLWIIAFERKHGIIIIKIHEKQIILKH